MINTERLLERFLRYTRIDTTACDEVTTYPSCRGQLELGSLLTRELRAMGLEQVHQDEYGLVVATLPANNGRSAPVVMFTAHLDTSPESSGAQVKPQIIRNYPGGEIVLPKDRNQIIRPSHNPELKQLVGKTIVTTDGTTLLGGDDKAGVAIIMELAETLVEQPHRIHGPVRILFTCDEEIGRGTDHVDLESLGATVAYTLDGGGGATIDVETFSADLATVRFGGVNIHPAIAKNRMVNAVRAASWFVSRLPRDQLSPESTSDREGFLHPYALEGGVDSTIVKILIRDFDTQCLEEHAQRLRDVGAETTREFPELEIDLQVVPQYRNMADGLRHEPRAVSFAQEALSRLGVSGQLSVIRGGTDGSLFTAKGLPTPNLSSGQHNPHSPLEWVCLEEMVLSVEWLVELSWLWGGESAGD